MDITIELFAGMARQAGSSQLVLSLEQPVATIGEALHELSRRQPALASAIERCACVAGDSIVRRDQPLPADHRIGLLPPVAGG